MKNPSGLETLNMTAYEDDPVAAIPPAPWWAMRVRHGSLLGKRLKHWSALALLGFTWYLSGLFDMAIHSLPAQASDIVGNFWGEYRLAKEVLIWLWRMGSLANVIATLWVVFWIYCDSRCTATEFCLSRPGATASSVHKMAFRLLVKSLLWAAVVGLAINLLAWGITRRTPLVRLLQMRLPSITLPGGREVPV